MVCQQKNAICWGQSQFFLVLIKPSTSGGWVKESLTERSHFRDEKWTKSVAVGSERFVTSTKEKLGFKAKGREVVDGVEAICSRNLRHLTRAFWDTKMRF